MVGRGVLPVVGWLQGVGEGGTVTYDVIVTRGKTGKCSCSGRGDSPTLQERRRSFDGTATFDGKWAVTSGTTRGSYL